MKTTTSRAGLLATASLLALTLTACSNGAPAEEGGEPAAEEERELGPLDEYFEAMYGGGTEEDANAQMVRMEEIIAECMREQGFEYTPVDYSTQPGFDMGEELDVEWGTLEFAEKYGYGATTNPWGDPAAVPEEGEEFVDPNQEYLESMSETERQAFQDALYGVQTFSEEEGEPVEYDWTTAGCSGKAQHEVYEGGDAMAEDQFAALQDDMESMYEAVESDPRLAELNDEWSACMADAGYPGLAAVHDAESAIFDEVNKIHEEAYSDVDYSDVSEEEMMALDREIQASVQEKLDEITPREIDTAVADFTCREEVEYDDVQQEVTFEHQQEFVDAHKDELEAWKAAVEAGDA